MTAAEKVPEKFASWAILELMGHRRLGGYVQEVDLAGAGVLRIDIPATEGHAEATQFYPPGSLYCLTPTTEELARAVAARARPAPVHAYELPRPVDPIRVDEDDDDFPDDEEGPF